MPGDWLERSLWRWKGASWWLFFGAMRCCTSMKGKQHVAVEC